MIIVHELNQLDFGGVEKVIRNIIAFDKKNQHTILAYKDGAYRKNLEDAGAKILLVPEVEDLDIDADVIHIHTGGDKSKLVGYLGNAFPVVETIHSPVRSPMSNNVITQRIGVCNAVSVMNDRCTTIKNGIDFNQMEATILGWKLKESMGIPLNMPIVGRLGRLGKDKYLEEWLLACYYLQQQGIEFCPMIVGDEARGCEGYRGSLKLMAESLPVKNVMWVGHKEDIANYLNIMDVFLYPSPHEGFGLVFAEALYMECMVVSYLTEVTFELFGGYSLLCEPRKGIPGLVHYLKTALTDENLKSEILSKGLEFITSEYDAERMSLDYQELYEQCYADFNGQNKSEAVHVVPAGS